MLQACQMIYWRRQQLRLFEAWELKVQKLKWHVRTSKWLVLWGKLYCDQKLFYVRCVLHSSWHVLYGIEKYILIPLILDCSDKWKIWLCCYTYSSCYNPNTTLAELMYCKRERPNNFSRSPTSYQRPNIFSRSLHPFNWKPSSLKTSLPFHSPTISLETHASKNNNK